MAGQRPAEKGELIMGVTNSNKVVSVDQISCDGTLKVTLPLTAAPEITTNPTDIALVDVYKRQSRART